MKKFLIFFSFIVSCISLFAQDGITVSGRITDKNTGEALIGVAVSVDKSTLGITSDFDGNFTINIPSSKATLIISYMGYKTQEINVTKSGTVNVILVPDAFVLDEVVAIGYGTMKKSDLTGAVGSLSGEQLKIAPVSGVDQALQGRLAGVTVNANSGQPGARADIRIRGIGTLNADASPLFVVDGVMVDNIDFLSPSDIQSMEVLKDASATAIYGSRGANGVILITTKSGRNEGKSNITYETYFGWQNRWKKLNLMGRDDFARYRSSIENYYVAGVTIDPSLQQYFDTGDTRYFNEWVENQMVGGQVYFPMALTTIRPNGFDYGSVDTDWQDEVFKSNAFMQNHYISVDGGNDKSTYAISANYFEQEGTMIGSWYKRLTLRANSAHQVKEWLKIGENLSFSNSSSRSIANNAPEASMLVNAVCMAPWDPTHYPEGAISYKGKDYLNNVYPNGRDLSGQPAAASNFQNTYNPFSALETSFPRNKWERWVGDLYLELTPIEGLTLRGDVSLDLSNGEESSSNLKYMFSGYDNRDDNFYSATMSKYKTIIYEATANYAKNIDKHNFNAMIGTTREESTSRIISGSGIPLDQLKIQDWTLSGLRPITVDPNDPSNIEGPGVGESFGAYRRISFLGRLHYGYDNKYLATVTFRRDGSSKFPKDKLWGNFPSMSLAWRATEEPFMKPLKSTFDMVKLRAGWGRIGNDKISDGAFKAVISPSETVFWGYPFGDPSRLVTGASLLSYPGTGKWETTEQWNVGIDFSSANGHWYGSMDGFIRETKDMLLYVQSPGHVGYRTNIMANIGSMKNSGVEFMLEYRNKIGDFNYGISGNATLIRNELTGLNYGEKVFEGNGYQLSDTGLPARTFWGLNYEGIFQSEQEILDYFSYVTDPDVLAQIKKMEVGSAKYTDLNKDGKIDSEDFMDLGNPFPWLTYGLNLNFDYKNFDLQVFFQGVQGNEIMNAMRLRRTEGTGLNAVVSEDMKNVWTPENPDGTIPNPIINRNLEFSSRFIENGSYFRLKNIQLGYSIPKSRLLKIGVQGLRFYIAATNLITVTNYSGYDPEVGVNGVDYGNYPQSRTYTIGAKLNF